MNDANGAAAKIPTQLYLISPLDVGGDFPDRLARAIDAGAGHVTAFQFRVKGFEGLVGQHEAAALAAPLQEICAARDVAFIVNDDIALEPVRLPPGPDTRFDLQPTGPRASAQPACDDAEECVCPRAPLIVTEPNQ